MAKILELEFIMAILIGVGIYMRRKGKITDAGRECLTDIVMDIIIPCNIFVSFIGQGDLNKLLSSLSIVGQSVIQMILCTVLGLFVFKKMNPRSEMAAKYGLINSNCMFIGLPVVQSLLGDEAAMLQSLYMIFVRCYIWTYGMSLYTGRGSSLKETIKKAAANPCMIAAYLGIVLMLFDIQPPEFIQRTVSYFSTCLMAMSMLLIGCVLSDMHISNIRRPDVWWFNFIRLLAVPAISLMVCRIVGLNYMLGCVVVLMAAMPAASLTAILAVRYGADAEYASLIVATSTILSIVTIPLWFTAAGIVYGI